MVRAVRRKPAAKASSTRATASRRKSAKTSPTKITAAPKAKAAPPAPPAVPAPPVRIPPILFEDDFDVPPPVTGPGRRFASPPAHPAPPATEAVTEPDLPAEYGTGRLWLTARDPHTLHAAWDLTSPQLALAGAGLALRIHAGREPGTRFQQVSLAANARSAFVRVERPGGSYVAEIGCVNRAGVWQTFAHSPAVTTPVQRGEEEPRVVQFVTAVAPPPLPEMPPTATASEPTPIAKPVVPPAEKPGIPPPPIAPGAPEIELPAAVITLPPAPFAAEPAPAPALPPTAKPTAAPVFPPPAAPALPVSVSTPAKRLAEPRPTPPTALWIAAPTPPWSAAQQAAFDEMIERMVTAPPSPSFVEMAARAPGAAALGGQPARPTSPVAGFGAEGPGPEALFSGAAVPAVVPGGRGFWFNINAELIVYGATEPDATVIIEGRPIRLRPDGSFTLRFALPDGDYTLRAEAVSADGAEARAARLAFARRTAYQGTVGPHPTDPALPAPPSPAVGNSASRKASRRS